MLYNKLYIMFVSYDNIRESFQRGGFRIPDKPMAEGSSDGGALAESQNIEERIDGR